MLERLRKQKQRSEEDEDEGMGKPGPPEAVEAAVKWAALSTRDVKHLDSKIKKSKNTS